MKADVVERLLEGEFICPISNEEQFEWLQKNRDEVDQLLGNIRRKLACTSDGGAFYAAYTEADAPAREVRRQFENDRDKLAPLVTVISALMKFERRDQTLEPGDVIRFGQLLDAIEANPTHRDELAKLARFGLFKVKKEATHDQLSALLNSLCSSEFGLLKLANSDTLIYRVTGRIVHLYDTLAFIQEHSPIQIEEPESERPIDSGLLI